MNHPEESPYRLYYDNGVYRKVAAFDLQKYSAHHDSLIQHEPALEGAAYKIYFTWASLLEAIGEGNFREKYQPQLDLIPYQVTRETSDEDLEKNFKKAHDCAYQYFLTHPELSVQALLRKIETQLGFSSSPTAAHLVNDTLRRYKKSLSATPDTAHKSMVGYLTWDALCGFPFAELSQIEDNDQEVIRKKIRQINKEMLRILHDRRSQGIDLNSYRLSDKIQKELLTSRSFVEQIEHRQGGGKFRIKVPHLLENPRKDLGDADVIHFATLGMSTATILPGIVLTTDTRSVIETRLILQLSIMRFLATAERSTLKLAPGVVYLLDPQNCVITDKIDVASMQEDDRINLFLDELKEGCKNSLVTFGR